jgi:hypothetical protein
MFGLNIDAVHSTTTVLKQRFGSVLMVGVAVVSGVWLCGECGRGCVDGGVVVLMMIVTVGSGAWLYGDGDLYGGRLCGVGECGHGRWRSRVDGGCDYVDVVWRW